MPLQIEAYLMLLEGRLKANAVNTMKGCEFGMKDKIEKPLEHGGKLPSRIRPDPDFLRRLASNSCRQIQGPFRHLNQVNGPFGKSGADALTLEAVQ